MKGELLKLDNGWMLLIDKVIYATDNDKLSIKNCQDIENGYDLDELASEFAYGQSPEDSQESFAKFAFIEGFQKAMDLMEGKKYSEEDVISMIRKSRETGLTAEYLILAFQQTEWEVEISEVLVGECDGNNDNGCFMDQCGQNCGCFKKELNLDKDGCLILKRV